MFTFSFFSLAFVGLMPVIAEQNFGIDPKSTAYGVLYACFGLGAALGAITVGTVFASRSKITLLRPGFVAFAVAAHGLRADARDRRSRTRSSAVLGYVYFVVITSLSTVLQDASRRRARGVA